MNIVVIKQSTVTIVFNELWMDSEKLNILLNILDNNELKQCNNKL